MENNSSTLIPRSLIVVLFDQGPRCIAKMASRFQAVIVKTTMERWVRVAATWIQSWLPPDASIVKSCSMSHSAVASALILAHANTALRQRTRLDDASSILVEQTEQHNSIFRRCCDVDRCAVNEVTKGWWPFLMRTAKSKRDSPLSSGRHESDGQRNALRQRAIWLNNGQRRLALILCLKRTKTESQRIR